MAIARAAVLELLGFSGVYYFSTDLAELMEHPRRLLTVGMFIFGTYIGGVFGTSFCRFFDHQEVWSLG